MKTKSTGSHYEYEALNYLKQKGLTLISQNFHCRRGEIDLICLDQNQLVFVEVRYRGGNHHGSALESVNYSKQQKIKKTAYYFLFNHPHFQHYATRFDVMAIDQNHINWVKNAF
jgi:putative endonuclease